MPLAFASIDDAATLANPAYGAAAPGVVASDIFSLHPHPSGGGRVASPPPGDAPASRTAAPWPAPPGGGAHVSPSKGRRRTLQEFGQAEPPTSHVLLAIPYDRTVTGPFFQSILRTLTIPPEYGIRITPFVAPGAIIHLSRDAMIRAALADASITHLVMVDSDQVFDGMVLPRLVGHDAPVVAPVITQRNGDPIPVAYREIGVDLGGHYRYEPLSAPIVAYISQFRDEWWQRANGGTAVLPLVPEQAPQLADIPPEIVAGLDSPLFPVDAVGTGLVVLRRDVLEALQPDPVTGLYCDHQHGGEDFSLMRKVRAAGWGGADSPGERGHGIFVDRGCFVGHLTHYARGVADLMVWSAEQAAILEAQQAQETALPPAIPDLVAQLRAAGPVGDATHAAKLTQVAANVGALVERWHQEERTPARARDEQRMPDLGVRSSGSYWG